MNLLQIRDLKKSYKRGFIPRKNEVLKGVSFSVPAGTITGFLGGNGAGKTTTMRCALGLDHPDSGTAEFFGAPLNAAGKRRLGFLPERPYFYEHLSGVEFLKFYAQLSAPWKKSALNERIDELLKRVDLTHAKDRPLRSYSKGMLQKIGLAQALIHAPELIILDEPMSGLDPDGRLALAEIILETAKKGTAVFFSSHLLHDMERLCQRLVVLKDGVCIYEGSTDSLLGQGGTDIEVTYVGNGERKSIRTRDPNELPLILENVTKMGGTIWEVRRARASLEDIFVKMALRGGSS